jgi:hypothetical protein
MKKVIFSCFILLVILLMSFFTIPLSCGQPSNVKILTYSWYVNSLGYVIAIGEVKNVGTETISSIQVSGTAFAESGIQSQSSGPALASRIVPGAISPFVIEFYCPTTEDGSWSNLRVTHVNLNVEEARSTPLYPYSDFEITSHSAKIAADGFYLVNGDVQNIGTQTAEGVTIIATFYNSSGVVVGAGYGEATPLQLAPTASSTFEVVAFDYNQMTVQQSRKIVKYTLQVLASGPILQGTLPSALPPVTGTSDPSSSGGQPTDSNDSLPTGLLYASVLAVVIGVVVSNILFLRVHRSKKNSRVKRASKTKTRKK